MPIFSHLVVEERFGAFAQDPLPRRPQAVFDLDSGERHRQMQSERASFSTAGLARAAHARASRGPSAMSFGGVRDLAAPQELRTTRRQGSRTAPARVLSVDHGEEALPSLATQLVKVHVDRGEGRPRCCGDDIPIIEADHCDVIGHAYERSRRASMTPRAI